MAVARSSATVTAKTPRPSVQSTEMIGCPSTTRWLVFWPFIVELTVPTVSAGPQLPFVFLKKVMQLCGHPVDPLKANKLVQNDFARKPCLLCGCP